MNSAALPALHRFDPLASLRLHDDAATPADIVPEIMVAVMCGLIFVSMGALALFVDVDLPPVGARLPMVALFALLTIGYCTIRFSAAVATTSGFCLAIGIGNLLGASTGYLVYSAGARFPLIDGTLYAIDRWLGFDWVAMLHWFADHPLLVDITRIAYDQAGTQIVVALPLLLLAGQSRRLWSPAAFCR